MGILLFMERDLHNTHGDNDNFDPWSSIGLAAAMILNRLQNERALLELREEEKKQGDRDAARDRADKEDSERHRDYVNQRLRELRSFERRFTKPMQRR